MVQCKAIKHDFRANILKKCENNKMGLKEELDGMINTLKDRIAKEIPDKGYFRNFAVNLPENSKSNLYAKDIALYIERDQDREGRAFFMISALHPDMSGRCRATYLMNGTRKELIEKLNNKEFQTRIFDAINQLSESLKKDS